MILSLLINSKASYDALLMISLKERQLGKLSNAAANASKKEEGTKLAADGLGENSSLLTRIGSLTSSLPKGGGQQMLPGFALPEGNGLIIRLVAGSILLVMLLLSTTGSTELILSVSTIGVFISQLRRSRSPLSSLGWSVVLLSFGLILGGLLTRGMSESSGFSTSLSAEQLEALPAMLLLWAGSLFLT